MLMNRVHLSVGRYWKWLAALAGFLCAHGAWAAACTKPNETCTEWIAMEAPSTALVYRSHALGARNEAITRALVIVHGGSRDAHTNFNHTLAAAFLADALEDTVIVSPRFASNEESLAKQSAQYRGGRSRGTPRQARAQ